ncbi:MULTISPECIES: DcaP family trimeric outer membrane transporter [unclassified Chryseobacterium]|uniref:DcaP family trimeric outer membrane transporter n=1 Tax=unclassified Chryseobacterium TaxID=2593645 RepID=UPI00226A1F95|nr:MULTISPECIES: DcaP family trimeric outer membrane transporter [unclassified Chryseobacterium]
MKKNTTRHFVSVIIAFIFNIEASGQITLTKSKAEDQNEWELYLKGFVQTDFTVDFQDMKSIEGFAAQSITVPQRNMARSNFSVKQSQIGLGIKQRNPKGDDNFSAYVEIDLYGPDGTTAPRFRQGYIKWKNWTAGQTWSNFSDHEIFPNIFDFIGPDGLLFNRRMQVRYSKKISPKENLSFSLEDPNTPSISLPVDSLNWKKRSVIPTFTAMYRYGDERDYIKGGLLFSPISYDMKHTMDDPYKTKTMLGWGAMISGKRYITDTNSFRFQTSYGKGYATNNSDLNGEKYDAIPNPANRNLLETLALFNMVGMYEHWWNQEWSSVASVSYSRVGHKDFAPKDMAKNFQNISLNLVFQPLKKLRMGVEGNYGRLRNFQDQKAEAWRIQSSIALSF